MIFSARTSIIRILALWIILSLNLFYCQAQPEHISSAGSAPNMSKACLAVTLQDATNYDTLVLAFFENVFTQQSTRFGAARRYKASKDNQGCFYFMVDSIFNPGYFSLGMQNSKANNGVSANMLDLYLIGPSDNIRIDIRKEGIVKSVNKESKVNRFDRYYKNVYKYIDYSFNFSGNGSDKYSCRYEVDRMAVADTAMPVVISPGLFNWNSYRNPITKKALTILNNFKNKMEGWAFETLMADFAGKIEMDFHMIFRNSYRAFIAKKSKPFIDSVTALYRKSIMGHFHNPPNKIILLSKVYAAIIIEREKTLNLLRGENIRNDIYYSLKKNYRSKVRDKLLTVYLVDNFDILPNAEELLNDAYATIQETDYLKQLETIGSTILQGALAFHFALEDTSGKTIRLDDFKGKAVLIDFWFKSCGACMEYYTYTLSRLEKEFKNDSNIVFVTINIDTDRKSWMSGIYDGKHTSPDIVNLNTGSLGSSHPVITHYRIRGYPQLLLIDKEGRILNSSTLELKNFQKVRNLLSNISNNDKLSKTNEHETN